MAPTVFKQDQLQHLAQPDRQLFTHFGLGEAVEQPFECVHHAFEHHANQHPYTFAVEDFEQKISYVELNRQANCLATHLRSKGIGPGSRICLLVERSILMVVGILGVLKAGAAYVPLDGNVVADKTLNHALKDSGSSLVLVLRKFIHRVGETPIMCLEDTLCDSPYSTHCVKPQDLATRSDSAYIIYTSGTTGVPKGVDVMHKNVTNLVCTEPGNLKMRHEVRVSQLMNISFDMAAWEILGSMCNGATLCLRGKTSKEWRAVMKTVDVVVATPSMLAPHKPEDYPNIKVVAVAGEPCPKALADNWAKQAAFYNCCGPTEITIVNTMHLHKTGKVLGIGGPTPNNTVYILDENAKPVSIGEMGIMWAGGSGITRGYLNLPDKTSEKYRRDPFLDDGSMMFNTGDLGRWLPDGDLEHLGRVDHQVKVKGFRVELDGVAAAMETTPGVKVATAILIKGELWGFYAPSSVSVDDVKAATARVQPHYAVPTKYVSLDSFPETANGKSDKRALEKIALESGEGGAVAPAKRAFKQDLLKDFSPADKQLFNKFGLGEAVKPAFETVHQAFEHHSRTHPDTIAVEDFSNKITFAELDRQSNCLATRLRASGVAPGSRVCLLVERSILMVVGILSVLKAGGAYVPLDGNVVADKTLNHALKDSGSSLVLVQSKFIHRIGTMPIMCLEDSICEMPENPHCQRPQDLAKTTDSAYIIYTSGTTGVPKGVDVMHKNVTNLVCMAPGNLKMGHGVRVSQLMNISFDMAAWEILGSMCNGSTLCLRGKTSKEWRAVMKTVDVVVATPSMLAPHKPEDYPNIKVVAVAGEPCPKALADNWAKTVSFYNCCGPTEITIVNTMHLHSPGIDLGIGGPTPNNTVYVLDANLKPVKIGEMGVMWAGGNGITRGYLNLPDKTAEKYQRDPFLDDGSMMFNTGDLGRWLPNGDLEHLGRVDHQVKVKGFRVELDGVAAAMETTPGVKVATAILIKGELWGFFAPSNVSVTDVKAATARVQPHYAVPTKFVSLDSFPETANGKSDKRALEKIALESGEGPAVSPAKKTFQEGPLKDLSSADKQLFKMFGLGETVKPAFDTVNRAFEHHARTHPDTIAVEDFGNKITFAELDRQSNCLATRLRASGVVPGSRVCLLVERSILMVVGILSVLKAGGAYVPLDGNVVADKTLNHALKDSGSSLVLVQRKFIHRIGAMPILCLEDSICESPENPHCQRPEDLATTTDSAYIIYTSGTTGVPKGVDVMHKNVTNLVCVEPGNLKMGHSVRVSQLMNISFDMAAWEILGSMCNGSTLCLRGKTSKEWRAVMKTVDVVVATPSMLAPHKPEDYPNIKVVAVAGEPCPKALADNWAKTVSFYNCCGPTEITIVNTMHLHSTGIDLGIGGPTPNNTVYVLDANLKPVKIGEMGVMWAGGNGITRGYLNLPDKTAEKYQRDPFLDDGSFMFNTGDLGRWLPNGDLEHLGRVDHQVKVKGFRVELDGVAAAMETTTGVKVATAILIDSELWGFFAPTTVSIEDVKAATSKVQPHYAVPTKFLSVDKFPETANGKSDKRALEQLARDSLKVVPLAPQAIPPSAPVVVQAVPQVIYETPITRKHEPQPELSEKPAQERGLASSSASVITYDSTTTTVGVPTHAGAHPMQAPSLNATLVSVSLPVEKKIEPSALEGQTSIWAGYEQDILPDKVESRVIRNLRHQIFYLYRRLFGIVFLTNLGLFIWYAVKGANAKEVGTVVVGNLFGAIMMRQDYVIDAFFVTFTSIPPSWPLWIRRIAARVYHIGGLHSGAGVSGTLWLILFCVQATREVVAGVGVRTSGATLTVTYVVLALLLLILTFAHPALRKKFHDNFEVIHRFLGWSATGLVWIQIVLLTNDYRGAVPLHTALLHSAPLWLIAVATLSLALPWIRLEKVPVRCEKLSNHAVRMYFDYTTPGAGSFVRLSDAPLTEWHSFATMPEPGKRGFSLVVSRAGDWTIKMINKPPSHIWKRGIPTYGVMKIAPMFRRLVVVATGSGIGPCTAAIMEKRIPIRVLWTAPSVRETFGDKLVDSILEANPEAVIYNTRQHGKPDMVKLTYRLVKEFNAEAVVIISNQTLTEKVVYGMMSRGIPAFGAIWDS